MAQPRIALLVRAEAISSATRLMTFAPQGGAIGFAGSQYIIVNTGIELAGGKSAKRAYSILSSDEDQHAFQIAVRRIGGGPGSNYMHRLEVGDELTFSGPWGKFVATGSSTGPRLIFATDTGITAALGLLQGTDSRPQAVITRAYWLTEADGYFLPPPLVRDVLGDRCRGFAIETMPEVGSATRISDALAKLERALEATVPSTAFLAGDGAVIYPMRDRLIAAGLPRENVHLEAFFNNPERKTQP